MNKEEFDYLGITKWHELGIKGQGITIASREGLATKHGRCVYDILKQVCPEADIKLKCDFNKDDDFDVYTTSLFFSSDRVKEKRSQQLIDKDRVLVCAAGNEGSETQTPLSRLEQWLSIGAVHLSDGKIEIPKYSSAFYGLDFMSFSNVSVQSKKNKIKGTSFSAPLFASMCALVQSYFLEKAGKKLTYNQMLQFVKVDCIDLNEKGYDNRSGYGLFVLPEPDKINISEYMGGITMFKDYTEWEQALSFLADRKRIDSPEMWKKRIKRDNDVDLKWFLVKWANDVKKIED